MAKCSAFLILLLCTPHVLAGGANGPVNCKVWANFSSQGSIGETVLQEIRQARSNATRFTPNVLPPP